MGRWNQESQYLFAAERDDMEMKKQIDDLEEENKRLKEFSVLKVKCETKPLKSGRNVI